MSMDLTGINNINEYYTNHYFASVFEENAADTLSAWRASAKESEELRTPWSLLIDRDSEDELIDSTEGVIDTLDTGANQLAEFSEELFAELMERIIVTAGTLTFRLKNGLCLTENIERR